METDSLLPTIQESEFEDESLNSFETVQRRRSPHYLVFGATLVFLMGFLSSRLFPSRTPDTSVTTWDMLGRDWESKKGKHYSYHEEHNKHHHKHEKSRSHERDRVNTTLPEAEKVNLTSQETGNIQSSSEVKTECENGGYATRTLKEAFELPFAALFLDNRGQTTFDASGVIKMDVVYAVSKNSWAIAKFGPNVYAPENMVIGDSLRGSEKSGYTALFQEGGILFAVRGSVPVNNESSHQAIIEELALNADKDDFELLASCPSEFRFVEEGLEGAVAIRDLNSTLVVLGLCGANHCGLLQQNQDEQVGHGLLVAFEKKGNVINGTCVWSTIRSIEIPKSANFPDYSDIALDGSGRVAISSKENSQVWVGQLKGQRAGGLWDLEALEWDDDSYVYSFPKNDDCKTIYCNIEGIHWLNTNTLIAVSGKVTGDQDFRCFDKAESAHVFVLP